MTASKRDPGGKLTGNDEGGEATSPLPATVEGGEVTSPLPEYSQLDERRAGETDEEYAERLTANGRLVFGSLAGAFERASQFIRAVDRERTWEFKGYDSIKDYLDGEFGQFFKLIPFTQRPAIVAAMDSAGLTNADQAALLGVTTRTIQSNRNDPPATTTTDPVEGKVLPKKQAEPKMWGRAVFHSMKALYIVSETTVVPLPEGIPDGWLDKVSTEVEAEFDCGEGAYRRSKMGVEPGSEMRLVVAIEYKLTVLSPQTPECRLLKDANAAAAALGSELLGDGWSKLTWLTGDNVWETDKSKGVTREDAQ